MASRCHSTAPARAADFDELNDSLASGLVKKFVDERKERTSKLTPQDALSTLADTRLALTQVVKVASTDKTDDTRRVAEKYYPRWAKAVRGVGDASIFLAETYSLSKLSDRYGGDQEGGGLKEGTSFTQRSELDEMLYAMGKVITLSGRTIREEARWDPSIAQAAIERLDKFVDSIPKE
ncbi:unnamed protein product [Pedinophyceae sp. YPF-701]|nr:unnamed protein product [Pedinophyceae sp. YPF-701]